MRNLSMAAALVAASKVSVVVTTDVAAAQRAYDQALNNYRNAVDRCEVVHAETNSSTTQVENAEKRVNEKRKALNMKASKLAEAKRGYTFAAAHGATKVEKQVAKSANQICVAADSDFAEKRVAVRKAVKAVKAAGVSLMKAEKAGDKAAVIAASRAFVEAKATLQDLANAQRAAHTVQIVLANIIVGLAVA